MNTEFLISCEPSYKYVTPPKAVRSTAPPVPDADLARGATCGCARVEVRRGGRCGSSFECNQRKKAQKTKFAPCPVWFNSRSLNLRNSYNNSRRDGRRGSGLNALRVCLGPPYASHLCVAGWHWLLTYLLTDGAVA